MKIQAERNSSFFFGKNGRHLVHHASKQIEAIMDEMFGIVCGLHKTKERLTVVIDKDMNSESNYAWIDEHARIHFVPPIRPILLRTLPPQGLIALNP